MMTTAMSSSRVRRSHVRGQRSTSITSRSSRGPVGSCICADIEKVPSVLRLAPPQIVPQVPGKAAQGAALGYVTTNSTVIATDQGAGAHMEVCRCGVAHQELPKRMHAHSSRQRDKCLRYRGRSGLGCRPVVVVGYSFAAWGLNPSQIRSRSKRPCMPAKSGPHLRECPSCTRRS